MNAKQCPICEHPIKRNPLPGANWYVCTACKWSVTYYDDPYSHNWYVPSNPDPSTTRDRIK